MLKFFFLYANSKNSCLQSLEVLGARQQLLKLVWGGFVLEIQTTRQDTPCAWLRAGPVNSLITTPGTEPLQYNYSASSTDRVLFLHSLYMF